MENFKKFINETNSNKIVSRLEFEYSNSNQYYRVVFKPTKSLIGIITKTKNGEIGLIQYNQFPLLNSLEFYEISKAVEKIENLENE